MRGGLCHKQTSTVTVIHYCTEDRQMLIAHCSSHGLIGILFVQNAIGAYPTCIRGFLLKYCHDVWYGKTGMVWLPDGEKKSKDTVLVVTEFTDGQTDGRMDTK